MSQRLGERSSHKGPHRSVWDGVLGQRGWEHGVFLDRRSTWDEKQ